MTIVEVGRFADYAYAFTSLQTDAARHVLHSASSETPPKVPLPVPSQFPANHIPTNVSPCCLSSCRLACDSPLDPFRRRRRRS